MLVSGWLNWEYLLRLRVRLQSQWKWSSWWDTESVEWLANRCVVLAELTGEDGVSYFGWCKVVRTRRLGLVQGWGSWEWDVGDWTMCAMDSEWISRDRGETFTWGGGVTQLVLKSVGLEILWPKFEPRLEHKKYLWVFASQKCCVTRCRCAQPPCVFAHIKNDHIRMLTLRSCSPCQSSVDYGNMKRPSMHFTDRRITVLLYSKFKYWGCECDLHTKSRRPNWQQASKLTSNTTLWSDRTEHATIAWSDCAIELALVHHCHLSSCCKVKTILWATMRCLWVRDTSLH